MKKTFLLTAVCLLATATWAQVPPITLNVPQAGTLRLIIAPNRMFDITDLTLTGNLNGTDIQFIREMAGSDAKDASTTGKLIALNLAGANIVTGGDAYVGTSYTSDNIVSTLMFSGIKLRSIVLPETVTAIDRDAFNYSTSLTSITFGSSVNSINLQAFEGCISLREFVVSEQNQNFSSVDGVLFNKSKTGLVRFPMGKSSSYIIPNNVRSVGSEAFANCVNLKSITIGSSVTAIASNAFSDAKALTEIRSRTSTPPGLGANAFAAETRSTAKLYVPKGAFSVYWVTAGWSEFQNIIEDTGTSAASQAVPEASITQTNNTELLAQQQEVFSTSQDNTAATSVIAREQPQEVLAETPTDTEAIVEQPQAVADAKQPESIRRRAIEDELLDRSIQERTDVETAESMTAEDRQITNSFEQSKGHLPMPVERGVITGPFGAQHHATLKTVVITNKGINIQAPNNADALVVFDGVVSQRFAFPGYNNAVIVRHGIYRTVYSNLTNVYVNVGDRVSAKQKIGKIFTDSIGNKTELFFMLYKSKELLNPCLFIDNKDCKS